MTGLDLISPTVACHDCEVHSILIIIGFILYRDCVLIFKALLACRSSQRLQESHSAVGLGEYFIKTCYGLDYRSEFCEIIYVYSVGKVTLEM